MTSASTWHPGKLVERLRGSLLQSKIAMLLWWWGRALASWLPERVRRVLDMDRGRMLFQLDLGQIGAGALQLRLEHSGEVLDVGCVPDLADTDYNLIIQTYEQSCVELSPRLSATPRWLLLPASTCLRRRLSLPLAAAKRLRDVVAFEVERQTPFSVNAVAFDARVITARESEGRVDAELVVVPLSALTSQLSALGPLAVTLAGVDVADSSGIPLGVNLLPPAQRSRHGDPRRSLDAALATVALLAIAATLWQVLETRRDGADAFEQVIASQIAPAHQAAIQRKQLQDSIEGQGFLDQARAARPTALEIIDELSRRLPDSTYVEKLAIEGERLTLIGLSTEAASLVGRLQGSGFWRLPALAGALQPDPTSGHDRFTLTAELAPSTHSKSEAFRAPTQ